MTLVFYNGRYVYIKTVRTDIVEGYSGYAYVCLDIERRGSESKKLFQRASEKKMSTNDVHAEMQAFGFFVLVSSRRIAKDKVPPLYYFRQNSEQVFDIETNYAGLLPLRVQSEETFRGHLVISFLAGIVMKFIQDILSSTSTSPRSLLDNMANHKCLLYDDVIITNEAFKSANEGYKRFKIDCPVEIPIKK